MATRRTKHDGARLLQLALDYAALGWLTLPCHSVRNGRCTCPKTCKCPSAGKHPRTRNGLNGASKDAATIRRWWRNWVQANIGIRTCADSGLVVLDVDGEEGANSLAELVDEHGPLPPTVQSTTGRGLHFYFRHPGPGTTIRNRAAFLAGLDIRGDGGYVIAPPSMHGSGINYVWRQSCSPGEIQPAAMPGWLLERISDNQAGEVRSKITHGPLLQREQAVTERTEETEETDAIPAPRTILGQLGQFPESSIRRPKHCQPR